MASFPPGPRRFGCSRRPRSMTRIAWFPLHRVATTTAFPSILSDAGDTRASVASRSSRPPPRSATDASATCAWTQGGAVPRAFGAKDALAGRRGADPLPLLLLLPRRIRRGWTNLPSPSRPTREAQRSGRACPLASPVRAVRSWRGWRAPSPSAIRPPIRRRWTRGDGWNDDALLLDEKASFASMRPSWDRDTILPRLSRPWHRLGLPRAPSNAPAAPSSRAARRRRCVRPPRQCAWRAPRSPAAVAVRPPRPPPRPPSASHVRLRPPRARVGRPRKLGPRANARDAPPAGSTPAPKTRSLPQARPGGSAGTASRVPAGTSRA
eukprot:scaffold2048_cov318-Pavlova_lutheri.AAC.3